MSNLRPVCLWAFAAKMGRRIDTLWVPPSVGCNGSQRRIQMARLSRPDSPRVAPAGRAERGRAGGPRRRRRPPAASRRARPRALTRRVNVTNPTHFPTPLCRALDDAQVNAHVVTHKVIKSSQQQPSAHRGSTFERYVVGAWRDLCGGRISLHPSLPQSFVVLYAPTGH